ncbi:MAG: hypothetical protein Ct9H300mP14_11870 [Gammaproteobacteria bacterium]|nr:MAG: hypothetical protein Ct9H300mP14_11870 [Gammaproteobacteria bacterium]
MRGISVGYRKNETAGVSLETPRGSDWTVGGTKVDTFCPLADLPGAEATSSGVCWLM